MYDISLDLTAQSADESFDSALTQASHLQKFSVWKYNFGEKQCFSRHVRNTYTKPAKCPLLVFLVVEAVQTLVVPRLIEFWNVDRDSWLLKWVVRRFCKKSVLCWIRTPEETRWDSELFCEMNFGLRGQTAVVEVRSRASKVLRSFTHVDKK